MNKAIIQKNIKSNLMHDWIQERGKSNVSLCVFMSTSKLKSEYHNIYKWVSQYIYLV